MKVRDIKSGISISTSIGEILLFKLSVGDTSNIIDELKNKIQNSTADEYIKIFIKYVCYKKEDLADYVLKPDKPLLTDTDINKFSVTDIENIAKTYIENNEYLFRKAKFETNDSDSNIRISRLIYGDIEYPKMETESYKDYLFRLQINQRKKLEESLKNSIGDISNFSKNLQKNIFGTFSLGEKLANSIKLANIAPDPIIKPVISKINSSELKKNAEQIAENKAQPFKDFSDKLDKLVDITAESIQFMIEANKLQTKIAEEIKSSSDSSTTFSKGNILISVVVLIVGILSFCFSVYTVRVSNESNTQYVNSIIEELKTLNKTYDSNSVEINSTNIRVEKILKELDSLRLENRKLNFRIKQINSNRKKQITTP